MGHRLGITDLGWTALTASSSFMACELGLYSLNRDYVAGVAMCALGARNVQG